MLLQACPIRRWKRGIIKRPIAAVDDAVDAPALTEAEMQASMPYITRSKAHGVSLTALCAQPKAARSGSIVLGASAKSLPLSASLGAVAKSLPRKAPPSAEQTDAAPATEEHADGTQATTQHEASHASSSVEPCTISTGDSDDSSDTSD